MVVKKAKAKSKEVKKTKGRKKETQYNIYLTESKELYRNRIISAIETFCNKFPDEYCLGNIYEVNKKSCFLIYKKVVKTIKITNANNMCMVFENCKEETFAIPILINLEREGFVRCSILDNLEPFGFKCINIYNPEDVERKLEAIN